MHRSLHSVNLSSCVAPAKPLISDENMVKRYNWALEHQFWSVQNFKRVLWSDETYVHFFWVPLAMCGANHTKNGKSIVLVVV